MVPEKLTWLRFQKRELRLRAQAPAGCCVPRFSKTRFHSRLRPSHTKHETLDARFTTSQPPNIINRTNTTEQTTIRNGRRQGYAHHLVADAPLARKILRVANTYDLL
jgi:hypothetical protein